MKAYAAWVKRRSSWVLAGLVIVSFVLAAQIPRLQINNDLQTFYPDDPLTQVYRAVLSLFGEDQFTRTVYVRFSAQEGQSVTSPQALLEMEQVLEVLRAVPQVVSAKGLPDLVKLISSGLHGGDPAFAALPVAGDPLGYSFAQVIQLTLQRLSTVHDFLSPQGTALVLAYLDQNANLLQVSQDVAAALAPVIDAAQATSIELMSYGTAIHSFNQTTFQDMRLLLPLAAVLMALILSWTFRLPRTTWLSLAALIAVVSMEVLYAKSPADAHWSIVMMAIVLCLGAMWIELTTRGYAPATRLKAMVAASLSAAAVTVASSWIIALLLLGLGIVFLTFRPLQEVYLPLAVVGMATLWTFGTMAVLGISLNFLMIAVFPLLIGVGLDNAIHLLLRTRQEASQGQSQAFESALLHTGRTLWYTTLTTLAGFAALLLTSSPPVRAFGVLSTVAMVSAFLVLMTLIPSLQRWVQTDAAAPWAVGRSRSASWMPRLMRPRVAGVWIAMVCALGAFAFVDGQQLQVFPYDLRWLLPPQDSQVRLYEQLNEEFKNYDQVNVLLQGDVAQLEVMRALNQILTPALSASPHARQVRHIGRLLDDVRFADPQAESRFLEDFQTAPDQAFLHLLDRSWQQPGIQDRLRGLAHRGESGGYDATVVRVDVLRAHSPEGVSDIADDLQRRLQAVQPALESLGLRVSISGSPFLERLSLTALKDSFFQSMLWGFVWVGIVLIFLFRSFLWGMICLTPMVLVMALELGTIHWLGLHISASTALVAALGIGLGVDYTIHMARRVKEHANIETAIAATAPALWGAAGTTLAAFLTLLLGQIPWNRDFGILVSTAIAYAFAVTLWVFPSLLAVMKPWLLRSPETGPAATSSRRTL